MIQVVNGYVCLDCADIALAKKDENPAHPPNDPLQSGSQGGASNTQSTPAVSLGGVLSQLSTGASVQQPNSGSQSASTGTPPPTPQTGGPVGAGPAGATPTGTTPSSPAFASPPPPPQNGTGALANFYA
jgi:hypothetical protein